MTGPPSCVFSSPCPARRYAEAVHVPPSASQLCHYAIIRTDLPLGPLGAQLLHAGGESSPGGLPEGTTAVVLGVPDEPALEAVAARLTLAGTPFVRIVENDAPYEGQLMAIGVVPGKKEVVGRALRGLKLLR